MELHNTGYAHVFVDGEDHYLFVRVLGTGRDASAQLVVHVQTGELFVRKVEKRLLDDEEKEKEDNERILFLVQSQARILGVQVNTAHLFSAEDVPASHRRGGQRLLYHRVKYFKFYNGGTLGGLCDSCCTRSIACPPSVICKMIQQVVHALSFLYAMEPYVVHGDAHVYNIFLHWDQDVSQEPEFFLGDFGWATCGRTRAGNKHGLIADIAQVWMHTKELLDFGSDSSCQSALRQYLEAVIEPELRRLAYGPPSLLPDLAPLLKLLSAAPAATPPDMRPFMLPPESHSPPSPLLYETWEEAKNAQGTILGPWHIGQVSLDPSSGKLNVVRMSPSTYHQDPNSTEYMHSESDEWQEIASEESEDWTLIPRRS